MGSSIISPSIETIILVALLPCQGLPLIVMFESPLLLSIVPICVLEENICVAPNTPETIPIVFALQR